VQFLRPNLVRWIVVDGPGSVCTGPSAVGELRRVRYRVCFPRRMLTPYPPYERDCRRWFRLRQQWRSDEVLELLREIGMTQEYVGPKRTSMIRVDHHRTPVLSQHQLGRGQLRDTCSDFILK